MRLASSCARASSSSGSPGRGPPGWPGARWSAVGLVLAGAGRSAAILAVPPDVPGRPGELLAQAAHRVADVLTDLTRDVADGVSEFLLELGQVIETGPDLLAALLGDPVHLPAVFLVVRDQAVLLEPGQPRVDGARRRRVHAEEPVLQQADDLIAVPGSLVQELQQVEPEPAMAEDRAHEIPPGPSGRASARGKRAAAGRGAPRSGKADMHPLPGRRGRRGVSLLQDMSRLPEVKMYRITCPQLTRPAPRRSPSRPRPGRRRHPAGPASWPGGPRRPQRPG